MSEQTSRRGASMIRKASGWVGAVLIGATLSAAVAQQEFIDGELLRDPTQPAHLAGSPIDAAAGGLVQAQDRSRYVVSFIRTGGDNPIAVINDQSLSIGDRVGDALVRDIRATDVILVIGGRELVLSTISRPVRESVN